MNRLNKTESAVFLYCKFSLFLNDPFSRLFCTNHASVQSVSTWSVLGKSGKILSVLKLVHLQQQLQMEKNTVIESEPKVSMDSLLFQLVNCLPIDFYVWYGRVRTSDIIYKCTSVLLRERLIQTSHCVSYLYSGCNSLTLRLLLKMHLSSPEFVSFM